MKNLLHAISRLKVWQQSLLAAMILLVLLTWLAVCLILSGYLGP